MEPSLVRDYTLLYLKSVLQLDISEPLTSDWEGGEETPQGIVGRENYVYRAGEIVVTISYPTVQPKDTVYKIKVEVEGRTLWEGELWRREFLELDVGSKSDFQAIYDYYGGVGLFSKGIHVVATSQDPLIYADKFKTANDYWRLLKENVTLKASRDKFISIIISRGDYPTGGYTIQVRSFSQLESYPVKLRFDINFTDPGEGVFVTEALTNPLLLLPIGKLSPGEYVVDVHIVQYILMFDEEGKPVYTPLETLREETWKQKFVIE